MVQAPVTPGVISAQHKSILPQRGESHSRWSACTSTHFLSLGFGWLWREPAQGNSPAEIKPNQKNGYFSSCSFTSKSLLINSVGPPLLSHLASSLKFKQNTQ